MGSGARVRDRSAGLGYRVARALYGRWRRLRPADRERLGPLADAVREQALELRGSGDREAAGVALHEASERLAGAMVQSAEADPEVSEDDVARLRDDLASELSRLADGDIQAERIRSQGEAQPTHRQAAG